MEARNRNTVFESFMRRKHSQPAGQRRRTGTKPSTAAGASRSFVSPSRDPSPLAATDPLARLIALYSQNKKRRLSHTQKIPRSRPDPSLLLAQSLRPFMGDKRLSNPAAPTHLNASFELSGTRKSISQPRGSVLSRPRGSRRNQDIDIFKDMMTRTEQSLSKSPRRELKLH